MTMFEKKKIFAGPATMFGVVVVLAALLVPSNAFALIVGESGTSFSFTAREGYISVPEGGSIYTWGYSLSSAALMQLPGPTLIVNEGDTISVTLNNSLPAAAGNVSIVFPGQVVNMTSGGVSGELTQEAPPGGSVTYYFTASKPGTYQYHSGTRPDLQVEMGLYGALIVRPSMGANYAYNHLLSAFDREYLFLLSEIDLEIHRAAQMQASGSGPIDIGSGPHHPEYWLINGRAAPDTMAMPGTSVLPTQPYNCMPRMHPGEHMLMRIIGAGRDMHPFHHHGNHSRVLARDGNLLVSETDSTKLAGPLLFTIPSVPGGTVDTIFEWTGKDLGWDIYGTTDLNPHSCVDNLNNETMAAVPDGYADPASDYPWEWCTDHNRPIPVTLPDQNVLAFGGMWSGSPYLGAPGSLPPGEGGLNPNAGYTYMWHSHTEREMVNNDVFPGGMMTMLIIEPPGTSIP